MSNGSALRQLKENASWFMLLGIGLIILGVLAIVYSFTSTLISIMYLGAILVIAGIFEAVKAFKMNQWGNFFLHAVLAILYSIAGVYLFLNPAINAITLTLVLAIFFVIVGLFRIAFALMHDLPHKTWLLLNGAITVLLGALIWYQWPSSGLRVIGTFVGIDLIFTGWAWIMLASMAKKA